MLSKHAGLWITRDKEIMYSQATHINFICPMRFDNFPLDTQVDSALIRNRKLKNNILDLQAPGWLILVWDVKDDFHPVQQSSGVRKLSVLSSKLLLFIWKFYVAFIAC